MKGTWNNIYKMLKITIIILNARTSITFKRPTNKFNTKPDLDIPIKFHWLKSRVHKHFPTQSSTESRACALSRVLERFIWGIIQARLKHGREDVSLCLIAAIKAEVTRSSGVARINWPDKRVLISDKRSNEWKVGARKVRIESRAVCG